MNRHLDLPLSFENPSALRRTREEYKADLLAIQDANPDMSPMAIAARLDKYSAWVCQLLAEAKRDRDATNFVAMYI